MKRLLIMLGTLGLIWAQSGPDEAFIGARGKYWAFQKVVRPPVPAIRDAWVGGPIDAFILSRLDAAGIAPSPKADKRTLLRRANFAIIGLPPTNEEVTALESDAAPEAFGKAVDRLLESPRYGERWARHWMDVARYSDSKGYIGVGVDRMVRAEESSIHSSFTKHFWID